MSQPLNVTISSHGFEYGVKHFLSPHAGKLSDLVHDMLQIESNQIQSLLKLGAIYIDNARQLEDIPVEAQKLFRVHTKPRRHPINYPWSQLIVYEDSDFLILNKPSGVPSHASVDNIVDNSLYQVEQARKIKLMITHRLDTLTEGLIVYGKSERFVNSFNNQIKNRLIQKRYVALLETTQTLPQKLIHYMESSPRAPKKVTEYFQEKSALCELEILQQKTLNENSWVSINLLTGRTHQIRAQTSAVGAPIVGDKMYGAKSNWAPNAIALRACEIEFMWNDRAYQFRLPQEFTF